VRHRHEENVQPTQRPQKSLRFMAGVAIAACSSREVPATWPDESPASPAAQAAPGAVVTRALEAHPPLPGEATSGWVGLAAPAEPAPHHEHAGTVDESATYTCPMHPEVMSDRPGKCPRCGMTLVERDAPQ
jgi:hypothetical protein